MDGSADAAESTRVPDGWWYDAPTHAEATARLEFVVDRGWAAADLVGPAGTGKTRLVTRFVEGLVRRGRPAVRIDLALVPARNVPGVLLESLRHEAGHRADWQALQDACAALAATSSRAVVVCDHADPELQAVVNRLRHACGDAITFVNVGRRPVVEGGLRIEVEPLDLAETGRFLAEYAAVVGRSFAPSSVAELHGSSSGRIDQLRRLAELAVVAQREPGPVPVGVARGVAAEYLPESA